MLDSSFENNKRISGLKHKMISFTLETE